MAEFLSYNGRFFKNNEPLVGAENRGLRYGDGVFETMKVKNGVIKLGDLHMLRLFEGLDKLHFDIPQLFTTQYVIDQVLGLCSKNKLTDARVRLSVFRGDGGLYDPVNHNPNLLIQAWPLPAHVRELNENGLVVGVYDAVRKSTDGFSNLKSANFLPYIMGALYAKQHQLNDVIILNTYDRIADSTIANLFCLRNDIIFTPSLNEGCVAGVMRRYLLKVLAESGYKIEETSITLTDLENAQEIFLTNAISGIRWVRQLGDKSYTNHLSVKLFNQFIKE